MGDIDLIQQPLKQPSKCITTNDNKSDKVKHAGVQFKETNCLGTKTYQTTSDKTRHEIELQK